MVIVYSIIVIAVLGIIFGIGLSIAAQKLAVPVDDRVEQVRELLPGANCGGCGFPGCDGFADAVVSGNAKPGARKVARVICQGGNGVCGNKGEYKGAMDCRSAAIVAGGFRNCSVACLGLGTCASVCKFGAISVGEDGVAKVNEKLCVGCGACVENCPVHSIMLVPEDAEAYVMCHNPGMGKPVMSVCSNGCIGCKLCAKTCPNGAICLCSIILSVQDADFALLSADRVRLFSQGLQLKKSPSLKPDGIGKYIKKLRKRELWK